MTTAEEQAAAEQSLLEAHANSPDIVREKKRAAAQPSGIARSDSECCE